MSSIQLATTVAAFLIGIPLSFAAQPYLGDASFGVVIVILALGAWAEWREEEGRR